LHVEKADWWKIVEAYRTELGDARLTPYGALRHYSVCVLSVISDLSRELWNLYNACGGFARLSCPADYYNLPALYVDAVNVIDGELQRIEDVRKANADQK